jgi:hypothetical protein
MFISNIDEKWDGTRVEIGKVKTQQKVMLNLEEK